MTRSAPVWIEAAALDDVPLRGSRMVKIAGRCLALFRTARDEVFVLNDSCPHKKGPLSQGIVHGGAVTCPLHNWIIDLASGQATGADRGSVETFPAKIDGGRILIDVSALHASRAA